MAEIDYDRDIQPSLLPKKNLCNYDYFVITVGKLNRVHVIDDTLQVHDLHYANISPSGNRNQLSTVKRNTEK